MGAVMTAVLLTYLWLLPPPPPPPAWHLPLPGAIIVRAC